MRIAVVGGGVAGLVAASLLHEDHDITLYESEYRLGGHAHTVDVATESGDWQVDTGFVVFNDRNYPLFRRFLTRLGVPSQPTDMSLSVSDARTGIEYKGSRSVSGIFAQRRNVARPTFLRLLADIPRFNRASCAELDRMGETGEGDSFGAFLERHHLSDAFVRLHVVPLAAAIWSVPLRLMLEVPARFVLQFFDNHGVLGLHGRPQWMTVTGGASRYVDVVEQKLVDNTRAGVPVSAVRRFDDHVVIERPGDDPARYDAVVMATHSDVTLRLLGDDATPAEREVLGAIGYQPNDVVLHTDTALLPRNRRAWASWNCYLPAEHTGEEPLPVTYNMNRLQRLDAPETFCVTLNRFDDIDPAKVISRMSYAHPHFTAGALAAQRRHRELNGANRTWFCGAYWGKGFHEDGVRSALAVCADFGAELDG
jgi:uncharacterized protein